MKNLKRLYKEYEEKKKQYKSEFSQDLKREYYKESQELKKQIESIENEILKVQELINEIEKAEFKFNKFVKESKNEELKKLTIEEIRNIETQILWDTIN